VQGLTEIIGYIENRFSEKDVIKSVKILDDFKKCNLVVDDRKC